jgi:ABC-type Fe3+/spermidine/putrescine transport system ATPase subunit
MTRVSLEQLTHRYERGARPAVHGVTLTIEPGELLCLVGPSGCGKTTLLKIVSGLIEPTSGAIHFDDEVVTTVAPERRRAVMVFQRHLLFPFLSVVDNVGFSLRMKGIPRDEWLPVARQMLARVHLSGYEERKPSSLSGGQQQRVALARALVSQPRVLLLDEPLSNLDRHLREDMRQVILELQRSTQVTTLCVTHDQEEAVLLGDRVAMLSAGQLMQVGTAQAFYERPVSVHVARFFGNHNQLEGIRDGSRVRTEIGELSLASSGSEGVREGWPQSGAVCVHIRPEAIELHRPPCELENVVEGNVTHRVYVGTHVRYAVEVAGQPWQVVAPPHRGRFEEGQRVALRLPQQRLWLTRD